MSTVLIEIGHGSSAERSLDDATDEWVWMRVHELRFRRSPSPFRVRVQLVHACVELQTPAERETVVEWERFNSFEQQIIELWKQVGMDCVDYTAGAAVRFMRRLRYLLHQLGLDCSCLKTST